ncbi:MAG TPA: DUF6152 family protein [Terriglobia bacterium]|nr:DUF6152 family protein [Terriglobia bacterium]
MSSANAVTNASSRPVSFCPFPGNYHSRRGLRNPREADFMNSRHVLPAIVLTMVVVSVCPLAAHHSISGGYDLTMPTHVQGTVVNVKWANPHVQFTIRGRDRAGTIIDLHIEGSSPAILNLLGWTKETLMPGMNIRVGGYFAKNTQYNDFVSTTVTIISTQRVLKTPVCWFIPNNTTTLADVENMNAHCPVPDVP